LSSNRIIYDKEPADVTPASVENMPAGRIAVLIPSLDGGGAERSMLNLVNAFLERGRKVDLVLCRAKGAYLENIPTQARLVVLESAGDFGGRLAALLANPGRLGSLIRPVILPSKIAPEIEYLRSLQCYLRARQPDVILSALTYANLIALWAKNVVDPRLPVVVSERIALSQHCFNEPSRRKWRWRYLPPLVGSSYPYADAIISVSNQVADDLSSVSGLPRDTIKTIYNPVVDDELRSQSAMSLDHPWFAPQSPPVILGVGRLAQQKDFSTLIRGFARLRANRKARLLILGEGKQRPLLEALVKELGLQADVQLPGFVANPFQFMARAAALVLSSEYEGLPGVVIQALACGCPVVSTDCPGGSAEILCDGEYGPLVPVGDDAELCAAVESVLDNPIEKHVLTQRAEQFSIDCAAEQYITVLDTLVAGRTIN
jgi:glycosyltransferase involved in cell wall biosynthesis